MPVTISEVAKACGVSRPTATLILNDQGKRYAADTRRRVLAAAQKLGYIPNGAARALVRQEVSAIGLLTGTHATLSSMGAIIPGIHRELRDHNVSLTLAELPDQQLTDTGYVPKILREFSVSGFLIGYTHEIPPQMWELIERHRIPSIWLNTRLERDCVYPDDRGAAVFATRRLIEMGHRCIGYLTYWHSSHYSHADRFAGYEQTMREAGLEVADFRMRVEDDRPGTIQRHSERWLRASPRPTAFVCYHPNDVQQVLFRGLATGLTCPRDLSVVTFHEEQVRGVETPVDTMRIPFEEVGAAGVQMLMQRIKDRSLSLPCQAVGLDLIEGRSTAPPNSQR
jgi:LacI family transcriptional regulator